MNRPTPINGHSIRNRILTATGLLSKSKMRTENVWRHSNDKSWIVNLATTGGADERKAQVELAKQTLADLGVKHYEIIECSADEAKRANYVRRQKAS